MQPDLAGLVGQQINLGKAVRAGEPQGAFADQHRVLAVFEHGAVTTIK